MSAPLPPEKRLVPDVSDPMAQQAASLNSVTTSLAAASLNAATFEAATTSNHQKVDCSILVIEDDMCALHRAVEVPPMHNEPKNNANCRTA